MSGHPHKLSIYSAPDSRVVLIEDPSDLEKQIGVAREHVTKVYNNGYARVQGLVNHWIGVEHAVESRVKSLVAHDEPLTPGVLYVAIATLTGSVVARNRSIVTRATLPAALLALSAHHFLPKTTHNVRTYAGELEDRYTPGLAHIHDTGRAHTAMAIARARESLGEGYTTAERTLAQTLGRVQDTTGLKVKDASVWGQQTADEAAARAGGVLEKVKEQAAVAESAAKVRASELANKVQDTVTKAEKEVESGMDSVAKKVEEPRKRLV